MLDIYVKEFISIVDYLQKQDGCLIKGDYLIADKKAVEQLMNRNNFEKAKQKLSIWRSLHWIDADEARHTKRVMINGKSEYLVKINKTIQKSLKNLLKTGEQK